MRELPLADIDPGELIYQSGISCSEREFAAFR
jgi:hypothetical protein